MSAVKKSDPVTSVLVMILAGLLLSCSNKNDYFLPVQHWQGIEILVQPGPAPVRPGATEFIVKATAADGRSAFDMVMSVRLDQNSSWRQAIQDGQMGVYRRGLVVEPGQETLYMQIKRKGQTGELTFPLHPNR
jgi:hypothetical protein